MQETELPQWSALLTKARFHSWLEASDISGDFLSTDSSPLPRVNYDKDWWQEIAEVLRTETQRIDPMNRAQVFWNGPPMISCASLQIICDVLTLEELGYVSHAARKDVLSYYATEVESCYPRWSIYSLLLLFLEFCNLQIRWTLVLCSHMRSAQECWMDLLCQDFEGDTRIDVCFMNIYWPVWRKDNPEQVYCSSHLSSPN